MQRGVKGDCEPVYWQGISVDLANIFRGDVRAGAQPGASLMSVRLVWQMAQVISNSWPTDEYQDIFPERPEQLGRAVRFRLLTRRLAMAGDGGECGPRYALGT